MTPLQIEQWVFIFVVTLLVGLVGYIYRDFRKELHELQRLMRSFSDFMVQAIEGQRHWESWRADVGKRLNNHSDRMNTLTAIVNVNREKLDSLEKWRDRVGDRREALR